MKFTYSWLKRHLATNADADSLARTLTAIGLEIEELSHPGRELAEMVVGRVTACDQHPNADKLTVCQVDVGDGGGQRQVVCGAPNARSGMLGIFAPPGTHIPGTGMDLTAGKIRGVDSAGMLLSEREVGLSADHTGIIDLGQGGEPGTPAAEALGLDDPVFEIGLTPNRADCAGVHGIARDLAAAGQGELQPVPATELDSAFESSINVTIAEEAASACPLFIGREIRGLKNGDAPEWMRRWLRAIGLRPISALVDVTNFTTFDLARPAHVFDADKLKGDIHVRLSRAGETLEALDGKTYELPDGCTVICDDNGVQGLGGVIGGANTAVDENTTRVFVEIATFDPVRTANTGRVLGIHSDARYRFERGVDPAFVFPAAEIVPALIQQLCGGEASAPVVAGDEPHWVRHIPLRPERCETLGGLNIAWPEQHQILHALGFSIEASGGQAYDVTPPPWRNDVLGEADLVEEVLRIRGYDAIPPVSLPRIRAVTAPAVTPSQKRPSIARKALAERGALEAVTWSFVSEAAGAQFGFADETLRLRNPIASDLAVMRPSILPNLLQAAQRNADRGFPDADLFEVGPVFRDAHPEGQLSVAAVARTGRTHGRHWAEPPRTVDVFDAKGDALAVLAACGAPVASLQVAREAPGWYHPGRSGVLKLGKTVLAQFGEIHPRSQRALDVSVPAAMAEVFLDAVPAPRRTGSARPPLKLAPYQPVTRDFAFLVAEDKPANELVAAAASADKNLIAEVGVFDVYQGKGVPAGEKSVALAVTLQPRERTLTDDDLLKVSEAIVARVQNKTGARLRG